MLSRIRRSALVARLLPPTDARVLKSVLPGWAISLLRRFRDLFRRARNLRLETPKARREVARQEVQALPVRPLISLVMPTYKTDLRYLREAVESVRDGVYPDWELIIVDDGSEKPELARAIQALSAADRRVKHKLCRENRGISAATNDGLEMCEGEFVGFLDHDDTLTDDALLRVAQALAADPALDVVYSDSDKLTIKGIRADPFLKPDWSPVYALGAMYIGHLLVVRRGVAEAAGGFDSSYDTIQDFEFMLRVSERTDRIHHIPAILYHWRAIPGSIAAGTDQKDGVPELQAKAVSEHLRRTGVAAQAVPHETIPHRAALAAANGSGPQPPVGLVIAADPRLPGLERLLSSLSQSTYPELEIVVVTPPGEITGDRTGARWLSLDGRPFSRAAANNLGAGAVDAEHLLFLAPDTQAIQPDWVEQLVLHAALPGVAAVGPALVGQDGKVEQAGVAIGLRDPAMPMLAGFNPDGDGYYGTMPCARDVSALSASCMLVARADFEREGGFSELYNSEYDDFDLCMRFARNGRRCAYTPRARLLSHRSEPARRAATDVVDRALFVDSWYDELKRGDPFFNPGFARQQADFVPAGWRERVYRAAAPLGMR